MAERPEPSARQRLAEAVLDHLIRDPRTDQSLRGFAAAVGVGHSLLLYHFGSTTGLLGAVHLACERRQREHLAGLRTGDDDPRATMRALWDHLAEERMWPLYRLGFALRLRADVPSPDQSAERDKWVAALGPVLVALGVPGAGAADEALLWLAACRGLIWELVTGADPAAVHRAAGRFVTRYRDQPQ
jgi:AcrR family transcriptional regulator